MAINIFDPIELAKCNNIHPKVDTLSLQPYEQEVLKDWAKGFKDRDNKCTNEFHESFHSMFLELFIFALLKDQNMTVSFDSQSPDFFVTAPDPVLIEAVVAKIKTGGRLEEKRTEQDVINNLLPPWENPYFHNILMEGIVRCSNALTGKVNKYKETYIDLPHVCDDIPYVIALSSYSQINYGAEYYYSMVALLFGAVFHPKNRTFVRDSSVEKPDKKGVPIDINLFEKEELKHVSAVIFTCTLSLGKLTSLAISNGAPSANSVHLIRETVKLTEYAGQPVSHDTPEDLFDGVFVFHNSNASSRLSETFFQETNAIHVYLDGNIITTKSICPPLVTRLNHCFKDEALIIMKKALAKYNSNASYF